MPSFCSSFMLFITVSGFSIYLEIVLLHSAKLIEFTYLKYLLLTHSSVLPSSHFKLVHLCLKPLLFRHLA